MKIDRLNIIKIEDYFSNMQLPKNEIDERIELAKKLKEIIENYFYIEYPEDVLLDYATMDYVLMLRDDLTKALLEYMPLNDANIQRLDLIAPEIIETTVEGIKDNEPYFTSEKRAISVACNEAQAHSNIRQFDLEKSKGMKYKIWFAELDERTRATHWLADGQKKPIDEPFDIGNSKLQFPMDISLNAELKEIINCRCILQFARY